MECFCQLSAFASSTGIAGLRFVFPRISLLFGAVLGQFGVDLDHDLDHARRAQRAGPRV
jgi:hypothetical protein